MWQHHVSVKCVQLSVGIAWPCNDCQWANDTLQCNFIDSICGSSSGCVVVLGDCRIRIRFRFFHLGFGFTIGFGTQKSANAVWSAFYRSVRGLTQSAFYFLPSNISACHLKGCASCLVEINDKKSLKLVRSEVIMTTKHCSFMNLGRLGFVCDLTTEKPTVKLETVAILMCYIKKINEIRF